MLERMGPGSDVYHLAYPTVNPRILSCFDVADRHPDNARLQLSRIFESSVIISRQMQIPKCSAGSSGIRNRNNLHLYSPELLYSSACIVGRSGHRVMRSAEVPAAIYATQKAGEQTY